MAAGVTQPGGAGTTIYIYDNASAANGTHYTFAEISAAFPVDFVDLGTNEKTYKSNVSLQIGDTTTNAATTTLQDTGVTVKWENGTTLLFRSTQQSSWFLTLGTKCGTGNQAGGAEGCDLTFGTQTILRGTCKLYGCKLRKKSTVSSNIQYLPGITGSTGEIVDCDIQQVPTLTAGIYGTSTQKVDNIYNCTFSAGTQIASAIVSNFFVTTLERVLMSAKNNAAFISSNATDTSFKDVVMRGTVVQGDLRANSGAARWIMVRPGWSQTGGPKLFLSSAFSITLANSLKEYWLYNCKMVNASGAAISNIPVKVTDAIGNTVVDTTTDANGAVSFGSGLTANAVIVMDHYATSGTYIQRYRGPFLFEYNTGNSRNTDYQSRRGYSHWPGYETVTTTAGTFADVNDIVHLQDAAGNSTGWTEREMP